VTRRPAATAPCFESRRPLPSPGSVLAAKPPAPTTTRRCISPFSGPSRPARATRERVSSPSRARASGPASTSRSPPAMPAGTTQAQAAATGRLVVRQASAGYAGRGDELEAATPYQAAARIRNKTQSHPRSGAATIGSGSASTGARPPGVRRRQAPPITTAIGGPPEQPPPPAMIAPPRLFHPSPAAGSAVLQRGGHVRYVRPGGSMRRPLFSPEPRNWDWHGWRGDWGARKDCAPLRPRPAGSEAARALPSRLPSRYIESATCRGRSPNGRFARVHAGNGPLPPLGRAPSRLRTSSHQEQRCETPVAPLLPPARSRFGGGRTTLST